MTNNPLNINTITFNKMLAQETVLRDRLSSMSCVGYRRNITMRSLEHLIKQKHAYEDAVINNQNKESL